METRVRPRKETLEGESDERLNVRYEYRSWHTVLDDATGEYTGTEDAKWININDALSEEDATEYRRLSALLFANREKSLGLD